MVKGQQDIKGSMNPDFMQVGSFSYNMDLHILIFNQGYVL